jgi:hypothetical protein
MRPILDFLLGAGIDVAWVVWANATTKGKPLRAAFVSMVMGAAGILGMSEALTDRRHAAAIVLGYGAGTYLATRFHKRRKRLHVVGA